MMKKLGFSSLGAVVLAFVYYFTIGATQLVAQMQGQVDIHIASLKDDGFSVVESNLSDSSKHYVLSLDNAEKISVFLDKQGLGLSESEIKEFNGVELGIDVHYLANTTTAISFDIYPLALPIAYRAMMHSNKDKLLLEQIDALITKKVFWIHIDVNTLLQSFTGYMKDIDEVITVDKALSFKMKGLAFEGKIADKKIASIKEVYQELNISFEDEFTLFANNSDSSYTRTDKDNYKILYSLEKLLFSMKKASFEINSIHFDVQTTFSNMLSGFILKSNAKKIAFVKKANETVLNEVRFDIGADNFDMTTLEKLENINPDDEKQVLDALQKLISHGIKLDVANFSIQTLELQKRKMDGFSLKSYFEIDKALDLSMLEKNPMSLISAMNAHLNISLSSDIFGLLAQQPEAMMTMMLFVPKDINGTKVYDIELKNSKLMVNGVPMM